MYLIKQDIWILMGTLYGQHRLLIDVSILRESTGMLSSSWMMSDTGIPGFAAKASREDAKLGDDFRSASPVSQVIHCGRHRR